MVAVIYSLAITLYVVMQLMRRRRMAEDDRKVDKKRVEKELEADRKRAEKDLKPAPEKER